jgi:MFS family permease
LPASIWALGFVSLFMDVSSEMIHALLPVFLVTTLGASATLVGLIEGLGEATASISKLFSGWLSDRLRNRKAFVILGYGLGTLSKPLFALAPSASWVLTARISDRLGKGIRGAPRDALVGEIAPAHVRGAAYGLRQSLDTVGAFIGPLLAMALMFLLANDFRQVFWIAIVPGIISVAVLIIFVREPERTRDKAPEKPIRLDELARLGSRFWGVVAVSVVLTLARFSEAFLILRAQDLGLTVTLAPLALIVMNIVYASSAYPIGTLSDYRNRYTLLVFGFGVLAVSDLVLAFAPNTWVVMIGIGLWGLHMGMTQGLLATLVTDTTTAEVRGTAFGFFNFASGCALLLASIVAGLMWDQIGPSATFIAGAVFTMIGLIGTAFFIIRD